MIAPPAALTVPSAADAAAGLPDFSERLSPMLVKELRQGLRSPIFVWGLITMNLFLAVVVWLTMDDPSENLLHQAFFGGYCALVCGLLPLRAAGALHDELRGNTIDTLILTRLTGWRITLGKWTAVVAQQLLASVTVLPYLIVRYFAGGINVPLELAWLGIFLLVGIGSAAVLTGFSWIKYFLFRAAIMMGMTFLTGGFCLATLYSVFGYRRSYGIDEMWKSGGWPFFALLLAPALHVAFFALDLGASKVGSLVENRALRRRLVGIAALTFYAVLPFLGKAAVTSTFYEGLFFAAAFLTGATLLVLGLQALLEHPLNLTAVVMPMVRRGFWGRLAGRFFYPGWPSGVFYLSALLLLLGGVAALYLSEHLKRYPRSSFWFDQMSDVSYFVTAAGVTLGMLPVPLVLWQLCARRRLPWHLGTYTLLMAVVGAVAVVIMVAASSLGQAFLKVGAPIPAMGVVFQEYRRERYHTHTSGNYAPSTLSWDQADIAFISGSANLFWWLLVVLLAIRAYAATRAVEAEAAICLQTEKSQGLT